MKRVKSPKRKWPITIYLFSRNHANTKKKATCYLTKHDIGTRFYVHSCYIYFFPLLFYTILVFSLKLAFCEEAFDPETDITTKAKNNYINRHYDNSFGFNSVLQNIIGIHWYRYFDVYKLKVKCCGTNRLHLVEIHFGCATNLLLMMFLVSKILGFQLCWIFYQTNKMRFWQWSCSVPMIRFFEITSCIFRAQTNT